MRQLLCLIGAVIGFSSAPALADQPILPIKMFQQVMDDAEALNLPWKVNDKANYTIDIGFIKGTMEMFVREENEQGFWVEQNIDLQIQKQKVEILYDKRTGKVLEMRVNGEKQNPPAEGEMEIEEQKPETITVPAGTFDTVYIRVLKKDDNTRHQYWLNMGQIPIMGLVQAKSPSQFGEVVIELTSFLKQ